MTAPAKVGRHRYGFARSVANVGFTDVLNESLAHRLDRLHCHHFRSSRDEFGRQDPRAGAELDNPGAGSSAHELIASWWPASPSTRRPSPVTPSWRRRGSRGRCAPPFPWPRASPPMIPTGWRQRSPLSSRPPSPRPPAGSATPPVSRAHRAGRAGPQRRDRGSQGADGGVLHRVALCRTQATR